MMFNAAVVGRCDIRNIRSLEVDFLSSASTELYAAQYRTSSFSVSGYGLAHPPFAQAVLNTTRWYCMASLPIHTCDQPYIACRNTKVLSKENDERIRMGAEELASVAKCQIDPQAIPYRIYSTYHPSRFVIICGLRSIIGIPNVASQPSGLIHSISTRPNSDLNHIVRITRAVGRSDSYYPWGKNKAFRALLAERDRGDLPGSICLLVAESGARGPLARLRDVTLDYDNSPKLSVYLHTSSRVIPILKKEDGGLVVDYLLESFPRGPTTWRTIDWDQRRYISTSIPEEVDIGGGDEEVEERITQALADLVDQLDPDVNLVNFSIDGHLISTSSDSRDDSALTPLYCPVEMIPENYMRGRVVSRDDLVEIERLSPCVDLITYRSQPGSRAVFKYQFHHEQALRNWHELNCWLRLSGHPNIVPFDCVVTDYENVPNYGTIQVVVGFTSVFVPGMTLQDNPFRLFKLKHLEQLIEVVDYLNLKFGIVHGDIAPRNLVINPVTEVLQIFDFSCAAKLGWKGAMKDFRLFNNSGSFKIDLMGVVATVYEVITQDTQLAEQVLLGADISTIEERKWTKHPEVRLDRDIEHYRRTLRGWLHRRNQPENLITHYTQAPRPLEWPQSWRPEVPWLDEDGKPIGEARPSSFVPRAGLRAAGLKFVEWERPAHNKIPDGFRVLANGTLVAQTDLD
ncbi:hypothetical protein J7T55_009954 [Diaporthe amygdali]|uniref:uncharacterized protein n=1 Tax=Phomopsis amygdali TaxID=1214568 RepID=UPI0022FEADDF|nr:uncharacterized protein J7T55_009954 [Diaporthe amygdali]KAJ0116803.1 hypothetical protein J7T55_009954 [Diaporthe amygdali]